MRGILLTVLAPLVPSSQLPKDVLYASIFPKMGIAELLRARMASASLAGLVDGYLADAPRRVSVSFISDHLVDVEIDGEPRGDIPLDELKALLAVPALRQSVTALEIHGIISDTAMAEIQFADLPVLQELTVSSVYVLQVIDDEFSRWCLKRAGDVHVIVMCELYNIGDMFPALSSREHARAFPGHPPIDRLTVRVFYFRAMEAFIGILHVEGGEEGEAELRVGMSNLYRRFVRGSMSFLKDALSARIYLRQIYPSVESFHLVFPPFLEECLVKECLGIFVKECPGVLLPPMTIEVSSTTHARPAAIFAGWIMSPDLVLVSFLGVHQGCRRLFSELSRVRTLSVETFHAYVRSNLYIDDE